MFIMKKYIIFSLVILLTGISSNTAAQINIITYNIRLNTPVDGIHAWPNRKDDVARLLKFHGAGIFCLQEALADQVADMDSAFPDYSFAGVGRDDGIDKGEYSPVFYDTRLFQSEESGHFWLAEDPGKPALGWDAACIRICSWVRLKDLKTGKSFLVFNTHFDHIGLEARKNAADLIISEIGKKSGGLPVILCGDFNLPPESIPVKKLSAFLNDSYTVSELPPHGSIWTFSGFTCEDEHGPRIDYIFVSEGIRVRKYAGLTDSRDGNFFSDHLPVFVQFEFK